MLQLLTLIYSYLEVEIVLLQQTHFSDKNPETIDFRLLLN